MSLVFQQTLPDMLNTAADSLRQLSQVESTEEDFFTQELRQIIGDDEANLLALLPQHAGAIDTDILDIKQRLDACRREVEEIWSDDVENEYELSSVFIHLGAAGYGHYYCKRFMRSLVLLTSPNTSLTFCCSISTRIATSTRPVAEIQR